MLERTLTRFVRSLRSAGMQVSSAEAIDAARALALVGYADREAMKSSQVIDCFTASTFDAALAEVRAETSVLIVATLTEFILSNGFCGTVHSSLDPVLASFVTTISGFCAFRPNLKV